MASRLLRCAACAREIQVADHDAARVYRCQACSGILLVPGATTRRRVPAGTRFGRFQLVNILARGARSTVFRALDTEKLRLIALKQLTGPEFHDSARAMEYVEHARALAEVDHPALVHVLETGVTDATAYVVLGLIEAAPLHARALSGGLALYPLLAAVRDVARGIACLHEQGFTHGRVHGENVLLADDGSVAALGSIDGATRDGDPREDLRAIGKLLYESVVGRAADAALPPSDLGVELQRDLEFLVVRAARGAYGSAEDLAADVDRFLSGKPLVRDTLWKRLLGG